MKGLDNQRRAILEQVAQHDPAEALELMWRFLGLASSVFARCDDSSGTVVAVFGKAATDLGAIAIAAQPPPERLAEEAFRALTENGHGGWALTALGWFRLGQRVSGPAFQALRPRYSNFREFNNDEIRASLLADRARGASQVRNLMPPSSRR